MRPEQIINDSFLEKFVNKDKLAIYFLYGHMQPQPGKATGNLTLNFLFNFKPEYLFINAGQIKTLPSCISII